MRLDELMKEAGTVALPQASRIEVRGLTADSRQVAPGFLFAALPGSRADGRAFIPEALRRGAVAVLAPEGTSLPAEAGDAVLIADPEPRHRLAKMAAAFHGRQPRRIAAVTGTNGKTSVASFTRQIWQALGHQAASLGTLGLEPERAGAPKALTTPDPVVLASLLAELADEGVDHLVLEASSHGLDQYRLDGLRLSAAAFTNLSRDHLDYHSSMESYFAAKRRLFEELLPAEGTAVLNADAPEFETLAKLCRARGQRVLGYGRGGRELKLLDLVPADAHLQLALEIFGRSHHLALPVAGTFQGLNALAALGLVLAEGVEPEAALAALAQVQGVPGRVEAVGVTPAGGRVFVDYAHTPGALQTVLEALRPHARGRLLVAFGAGGDRDPGKRPLMGEVAARLADAVIVTDDNPRSEDRAAIRAAILAAAPGAEEIGDRRTAIRQGVAALGDGDLFVVAGKGHEQGQTIQDRVLPFDDREEVRRAIAELQGGKA
ncbi:UDP-N-acetylmuramoyl-L-alanyl-D-glutamate--2,6-diaminopimelate ligase [Aquibaculum sediminis]|uniref:UDP-N-acetylmuramoyl-L-alanyl-D-glutamate--2, 6-diaminopimelate ligase n=1 Tax=Aquibaculum sediminis TaxID=3231907 RepID=UPI003457116D